MHRLALLAVLATSACTGGAPSAEEAPVGVVKLAAVGETHDVTSVRFQIAESSGDCSTGPFVDDKTMPVEYETLDPALGGGDKHRFSDALFVLPPGPYLACGTPLRSSGKPSNICGPASANVDVVTQVTNEIVLVSQCDAGTNGGLDVVLALNDPPSIDDLDVAPSKFIEICEAATVTLVATDPDGDPLSYAWQVIDAPTGSIPSLVPAAETAVFTPDVVGDFTLRATVTDIHLAEDSVEFPIHVAAGTCQSAGTADWVQSAGSTSADRTLAVAVAPNGDVFAGGFYRSSGFGFGAPLPAASSEDGFIVKMTPAGGVSWQRQLTSSFGNEHIVALATDSQGDLFVAGTYTQSIDLGCQIHSGPRDIVLGKLDGDDGSCLWSIGFGGDLLDEPTELAVDGSDDVVLGGTFASTDLPIPGGSLHINMDQADLDIFYLKRDGATGAAVWDHAAGTTQDETLEGLAIDQNGDVFIGGNFAAASMTFTPGVVAAYGLVGSIFIGKLSGISGNMSWVIVPQPGGSADAALYDLAVDSGGGVVAVGDTDNTPFDLGGGPVTTTGLTALFVTRLRGSDGTHDFTVRGAQPLGGAGARAIAIDPVTEELRIAGFVSNGLVDFGGMTVSPAFGGRDVFVASLSGFNGDPRWHVVGGSDALDEPAVGALAVDALGATYIGGWFGNGATTDFVIGTSAPVTPVGNHDAFLAKLLP